MTNLDDLRQGLKDIEKREAKKMMDILRPYIKKQEKDQNPVILSDNGKGRCRGCDRRRKLGQRGKGKGLCKRCKKEVKE